jgi:hypothetical protein
VRCPFLLTFWEAFLNRVKDGTSEQ